jgi:SAM-dependent methyltransferase/tetratricopeptide (TPR) repeat protein
MEISALIQKVMTSHRIVVPENAALIGGTKENFLDVGCDILRALCSTTPITPASHILEIGSGLGRIAYPLTFYLEGGRYVGLEIVKHMTEFCTAHVTPLAKPGTSFEFMHLDCYNEFYNPDSKNQLADVEFPNLGDFDIVFMSSVCTHLEDRELQLYFQKAAKWLRPGGTFWATFFLIDKAAENQLRHFRHRSSLPFDLTGSGPDYYLDARRSTLAVAYYPDYVRSKLAESGLRPTSIYFASWSGVRKEGGTQDLIVAKKVAAPPPGEQEIVSIFPPENRGTASDESQQSAEESAGKGDAVLDPDQILRLTQQVAQKINRSVLPEEVEHAAGLMRHRLSMPDLIAAYLQADPPVRDVERELLAINAEQADQDGKKELAELYRQLAEMSASVAAKADGWKAMVDAADRATGEGRMEDALAILFQCAEKYPTQVEVLALLATILSFRKRYSEAAGILRRAIVCAPEDARLHAMLGTLMTLQGDLPLAAAAYARALQIEPGYAEAKSNLELVKKNLLTRSIPDANIDPGPIVERKSNMERSMEAYADIILEGVRRESVTELPPEEMIALVIGNKDANVFRDTGKSVYLDFSLILLKYFQRTWTDFQAILDFGVGSGRIARWMPTQALTRLYGVDVNGEAVQWCQKNLIGAYSKNNYDPPLAFPDGSFDCVYSFSVFSHMDNETALKWIKELHRITREDGVVMITTHLSWASTKLLNPEELAMYKEQGYVYREYMAAAAELHDTRRYINSFMTERYLWEMWRNDFELIGVTAGNNKWENVPVDWEYDKPQFDMGQGVAVFRKITKP